MGDRYRACDVDVLDDEHDNYRTIVAHDAEQAAERYAERDDWDSAEYSVVGGSPMTVQVIAPDGTITRWLVTGETVAVYSAREVRSG